MTTVKQVRGAVAERLLGAGVPAMVAYSEPWAKTLSVPTAVVGLRRAEIKNAGFLDYLGQRYDEALGTEVEVYGREIRMTLSLDIYSPKSLGVEGCEETAERVAEVLLSALPSGLRAEELVREEAVWDEKYGLFLLRGSFNCTAYFLAQADEDTTVLTDFILKGVVEK